jgi:ribosomal protein L19
MKKILLISYLLLSTNLFGVEEMIVLNTIINRGVQIDATIRDVKIKDIEVNGNFIGCNKAPHYYIQDKKNFKKFTKLDYELVFWNQKYYPCSYLIIHKQGKLNLRGSKKFSKIKKGDQVRVKLKVFEIYTNDKKVHNVAVITDMKKRK